MKIYIKSSRYVYEGSIADRYGNILIRDAEFYTNATSFKKAKSNVLSQAKKRLGLKQSAYLKLCRPENLEETIDYNEQPAEGQETQYCPNCGTPLTDGGFCPKCYAEGDESNYS